jgi:hypothetical protein
MRCERNGTQLKLPSKMASNGQITHREVGCGVEGNPGKWLISLKLTGAFILSVIDNRPMQVANSARKRFGPERIQHSVWCDCPMWRMESVARISVR